MKSAGAIQKNTEKRASRDVLFPLCENAADKLILFVLLGSVLLFILWPIACIALRSLRGADGGVSFAMFGTVLRQYGESLRNSVFVGVFTAVLSTILSLSAALVCATARGWKKTLCMIIMLVAMVSPPFVSSLAYIQLYGRRGWITYRLLHLSLNPYNRWGVILMQSISFVPLNAMFLSGILEKLEVRVRVLQMQGAKDPDEYIKTFGADAFRNLLEQSENHIDYRLGAVQRKYDPQIDEQRVAFVKEAAGIVAELPGSVEREVYAMRVAETAGMPAAVVTDEVQRQRKRRLSRARKEQERDLLRPATAIQPPGRSIRFDDPRSAAAEQGIIRLLYLDPGLFYGRTNVPDAAQFSSPELRHIYTVLLAHGGTGTVQIAALSGELAPDELALLTGIIQQPAELSNGARALDDYISILQTQSSAGTAMSETDLLAFANKLKEHKGYGGKDGTERHE